MRVRIASSVMKPILFILANLLGWASWLQTKLSGLKPLTTSEERLNHEELFNFNEDRSFQELMESKWFLRALRTISKTQSFRLIAEIRAQVAKRDFEEASQCEAAVRVFEDLEAVFHEYAKLYGKVPPKRRP